MLVSSLVPFGVQEQEIHGALGTVLAFGNTQRFTRRISPEIVDDTCSIPRRQALQEYNQRLVTLVVPLNPI
jgi:hypothetical protein